MRDVIIKILKSSVFISFGLVLFWLVYKDFDINSLIYELKNVNLKWVLLIAIASILSHVWRAIRWQMLLNSDFSANEEKPVRFVNAFLAVFVAYFVNMAIPRLGEVSRCVVISENENRNFITVLGTVISERVIDLLCLTIFIVLCFFVEFDKIYVFFNSSEIKESLSIFTNIWFLGILLLIIGLGIMALVSAIKGRWNHIKFAKFISDLIIKFWKGFKSIKDINKPFLFVFHSLFIWFLYFVVMYLSFLAIDGYEHLGVGAAFVLFVVGSLGMLAPTPNGIGAYHFMIIQALLLYGIANEKAVVFALIIHSFSTIIIVLGGLLSFILLPIVNRDK